jgi:hypothetical protein
MYNNLTYQRSIKMCRNIKPLFNFQPAATDAEIQGASLQYVRKISGFPKPSNVNGPAFEKAVRDIAVATHVLLDTLVTAADPHDRETERANAKARSAQRFGPIKNES